MHTVLETVQPCEANSTASFRKLFKTSPPTSEADIHNLSVKEVIQQKLSAQKCEQQQDQENAFFVADLGEVYRQHLRWKSLLPRIEPFFGN